MKKILMILALLPAIGLFGAPSALANEGPKLERAPIDPRDLVSLQNGAHVFVNYCLNCHSASMMRYNRMRDIGLSDAQIKDNLLFAADKVGELMTVAMPRKDAKEWFGVAPPDLSVIARSRGADWLYGYLRGFYRDPSRPSGWNNTVSHNVAMPHVLWTLQGERTYAEVPVKTAAGEELKDSHGNTVMQAKYEQLSPGSMTALEYDHTARDLVAFLAWVAEPAAEQRKQVGYLVLMALGVLLVLVWLLKKEFWKDVH